MNRLLIGLNKRRSMRLRTNLSAMTQYSGFPSHHHCPSLSFGVSHGTPPFRVRKLVYGDGLEGLSYLHFSNAGIEIIEMEDSEMGLARVEKISESMLGFLDLILDYLSGSNLKVLRSKIVAQQPLSL